MEDFWLPWLGLPWAPDADPRTDGAASCLRLVQAAREELGLPWPAERSTRWLELAQAGRWGELNLEWQDATHLTRPAPGAIVRLPHLNEGGRFGLAVMVAPEFVLTSIERRGVTALPQAVWRPWAMREPLP